MRKWSDGNDSKGMWNEERNKDKETETKHSFCKSIKIRGLDTIYGAENAVLEMQTVPFRRNNCLLSWYMTVEMKIANKKSFIQLKDGKWSAPEM